MELISSSAQLAKNVQIFNDHADEFAGLIPYYRAWYGLRTKKGWILGPSKFIGYNITPEKYLQSQYSAERHGRVQREKDAAPLDGRVTEGLLKQWSELVEEGHPSYNDLRMTLSALCGRYGKKPNTLARVSIIKSEGDRTTLPDLGDELVALMVGVYRKLTPAQKSAFRKQVA